MKEKSLYCLSIILVGNFNPAIYTPAWMSSKGLIREDEAEKALVEIIHPEVSKFQIDWLIFEGNLKKLEFRTNKESHFKVLKDLIISVFGLLKETPISACGINHLCHYTLPSIKQYHDFGYWFSPVQEFNSILNEPKVSSIQYIETKNPSLPDCGAIRLIITPSDLITDDKSILIYCNHHFDNSKTDAKSMMSIISSKWDYSFDKTNNLIELIWKKVQL